MTIIINGQGHDMYQFEPEKTIVSFMKKYIFVTCSFQCNTQSASFDEAPVNYFWWHKKKKNAIWFI